MSNYSISTAYNSITVSVPHINGFDYYRIFCRKASETNADNDDITQSSGTITASFSADPSTAYVVRVRYSVDSSTYSTTNYTLWYDNDNETANFTTPDAPSSYTLQLTIIYDANGGSGAPSDQYWMWPNEPASSAQKTITLSNTEPTLSGYVFDGWLIDGSTYSAGSSITLTVSTRTQKTAVAQWTQRQSKAYIYATKTINGVATPSWWPATPYIYTGSGGTNGWHEATPYIYTSSDWQ